MRLRWLGGAGLPVARDTSIKPFSGALFFDIDGTLLDHDWAEERAAELFFGKHRDILKAQTVSEFSTQWRDASSQYMEQFLRGRITFAEQRTRRCREVTGRDVSDRETGAIFGDYLEAYEANWRLFEDVADVLNNLAGRGVPMGVISNGSAEQQTLKLRRTDLIQYFDPIVISESVGVSKPDRLIFETAARRMGRNADDCIHVGDSLEGDVAGALAAGMRAIWVNRSGKQLENGGEIAAPQAKDLNAILPILDSMG